MSGTVYQEAIAPVTAELAELAELAPGCPILDAHTHLGLDEDGRQPGELGGHRRDRLLIHGAAHAGDPFKSGSCV